MKQLMKRLLLRVLAPFHAAGRAVGFVTPGIAVLMYHSVGPGDWEFTVSDDAFKRQLDMLARHGFTFISLSDFERILNRGAPIQKRSVLLTFDDGYGDILRRAMPLMASRHIRPVLYVHTDRSNAALGNTKQLMSWDELRNLRSKADIGDHSYSHPVLRSISHDALERELLASQQAFTRELGHTVHTYAYPGGKYNDEVVRALRAHGYSAAFTITPGLVRPGDDPLRLRRIGITSHMSDSELYAHAIGVGEWYGAIIGFLRTILHIT
jgi:peptidoglycan/xylan/chitin deacetylase (PgdA/CDA1 family)